VLFQCEQTPVKTRHTPRARTPYPLQPCPCAACDQMYTTHNRTSPDRATYTLLLPDEPRRQHYYFPNFRSTPHPATTLHTTTYSFARGGPLPVQNTSTKPLHPSATPSYLPTLPPPKKPNTVKHPDAQFKSTRGVA